jgi:hypothetical protein
MLQIQNTDTLVTKSEIFIAAAVQTVAFWAVASRSLVGNMSVSNVLPAYKTTQCDKPEDYNLKNCLHFKFSRLSSKIMFEVFMVMKFLTMIFCADNM